MAGGRTRRGRTGAVAVLLATASASSLAQAPLAPPLDRGAVGLGLALRRLGVSARVLYVAAHPDDENNGALVALARGLGVRVRLFTLTRGEGGQNEIGPELDDALGVLRTEELLAVHRPEGVEQSFGRAVDFGYSFSVEETFDRWGKDDALADVVREVRTFRPDVILTLPVEANQGGLHHKAVAALAKEAFRAAADPNRFPEQVRAGRRPWQAAKIYEGGVGGGPAPPGPAPVAVATAAYDPLLGMSAQEMGSRARTAHRSQRVSQLYTRPGEGDASYLLVDSQPPVRWPESDILQGVDVTVTGLVRFAAGEATARGALSAELTRLQADTEAAKAAFDARAPERLAPALAAALAGLRRLREDTREHGTPDLLDRLDDEEKDLVAALGFAHGLAAEALADDPLVTPGQRFTVATTVWNQGQALLTIEDATLRVPAGWTAERVEGAAGPVAGGQSVRLRHAVTVAAEAPASQPYWRGMVGRDRHALEVAACEALPFCPEEATAIVRYRSGDTPAQLEVPVTWRREGPAGEKSAPLQVVPPLAVRLQPAVVAVARARPRPRTVRVTVVNNRPNPVAARVRLQAPAGWMVKPPDVPLAFAHEDQALTARFSVTPPPSLAQGTNEVRAVARSEGRDVGEGDQVIDYPHIQERRLYRPAAARLLALDVQVRPGVTVGYVMGTGDEVPAALEQLGVPVTMLEEDDLAAGDLGRFTAIVVGIRAYQARPDLRAHQGRLQRFMEEGGHVVVQYNRLDFNQPVLLRALTPRLARQPDSPFAPYPAAVSQRRVTDEGSPVKMQAAAAVLGGPNRIGDADWAGWVQERGTYFLDVRDGRYHELLALRDPFPLNSEEQKGALVEATVGRGTWTYVGLALFRQLPAGVPGAYRLLANLVSRPRRR